MSVKSAKQISQKYRFYICPIRTATETENQIGMWQLVLDNTRPMPDFHVKNHIYDLLSSIIKGFPALILCAKCWKPSSTSGCCSYFEIQRNQYFFCRISGESAYNISENRNRDDEPDQASGGVIEVKSETPVHQKK